MNDDPLDEARELVKATTVEEKPGFWKRQSMGEPKPWQRIFDTVFGGIVPIVLLIIDPIVFRGDPSCVGPGVILPHLGVFAYLAIGSGVVLLLGWLAVYRDLARWSGLLAGLFQAGFVFALVLGLVMLPLSVPGLIVVIGALGFLPFLTAFVYRRNAIRAQRMAKETYPAWSKRKLAAVMVAGAALVLMIPLLAQWQTSQIIRQTTAMLIVSTDPQAVEQAEQTLRTLNRVCLGFCTQNIQTHFEDAIHQHRELQARFQQHFEAITGDPFLYVDCSTVFREGVMPLLLRLLV